MFNSRILLCKCFFIYSVIVSYFLTITCQVFDCHDDPELHPPEGQLQEPLFTWLGALQYIHIEKGNPHYFRVPRVILVSPQFVLAVAADAGAVPPGYALGNVIFTHYERDPEECGLTENEIDDGQLCKHSSMLMPIADVLLHPEYKNFGIKNSVALLKLLKEVQSSFMLPVCLPNKNFLFDQYGQTYVELDKYRHIDYPSDAPRDFTDEYKEIQSIEFLPRELCVVYDPTPMLRHEKLNIHKKRNKTWNHGRTVCSTGCGFRSGAPTIIHEHTGHWTLVALAKGGPQCPDPLRSQHVTLAPHHIPIFPYVPWITTAIYGKVLAAIDSDDPFGLSMPRAQRRQNFHPRPDEIPLRKRGWVGRWWMGGLRCYDRGIAADDLYRFYFDILEVTPTLTVIRNITHTLDIYAPKTTLIDCVKIGMPWFARVEPHVWNLHTSSVTIFLYFIRVKVKYRINIEAWGHNLTTGAVSNDPAMEWFSGK